MRNCVLCAAWLFASAGLSQASSCTPASLSTYLNSGSLFECAADLTGVTDQVTIQFSPTNQNVVDVIKIQALVSILGGSASDTGFGNSFTVADIPEPGTAGLFLLGGLFLGISLLTRRQSRYRRENS